jgi:uncharacterized OB-fold protein
MSSETRALPVATDLTRPFWLAAKEGKLVVQHCISCNKNQFFPRPFCLHCMSSELEWIQSNGTGTIYTFTINRRGSDPYMNARVPYAVAMIELDEGVRLMANIVDSVLEQIQIGGRVHVTFEALTEHISLPQFRLTSDQTV